MRTDQRRLHALLRLALSAGGNVRLRLGDVEVEVTGTREALDGKAAVKRQSADVDASDGPLNPIDLMFNPPPGLS